MRVVILTALLICSSWALSCASRDDSVLSPPPIPVDFAEQYAASRALGALQPGEDDLIRAVIQGMRALPPDGPAFITTEPVTGRSQGGDVDVVRYLSDATLPFDVRRDVLILFGRNAYLHRKSVH